VRSRGTSWQTNSRYCSYAYILTSHSSIFGQYRAYREDGKNKQCGHSESPPFAFPGTTDRGGRLCSVCRTIPEGCGGRYEQAAADRGECHVEGCWGESSRSFRFIILHRGPDHQTEISSEMEKAVSRDKTSIEEGIVRSRGQITTTQNFAICM